MEQVFGASHDFPATERDYLICSEADVDTLKLEG